MSRCAEGRRRARYPGVCRVLSGFSDRCIKARKVWPGEVAQALSYTVVRGVDSLLGQCDDDPAYCHAPMLTAVLDLVALRGQEACVHLPRKLRKAGAERARVLCDALRDRGQRRRGIFAECHRQCVFESPPAFAVPCARARH